MHRPALSTLVPYTLGVFIAESLPIPLFWPWLIALSCLIGSFGLSYLRKEDSRTPRMGWVLLFAALAACGMFRLKTALTSPIPPELYGQRIRFSGQMTYQPERGELWPSGYAKGQIRSMENPDLVVKAKLLIRFREPISLRYGAQLEVEGVLRRPKGRRNPGGFDYRSYLARRQVFGILQPHRHQEIVPTHRSGFPLLRWTERLHRQVESVIAGAYHENPLHAQVLRGMFLGQRSELPPDILDAFRYSGTLHILALSGLHVGTIAGLCFLGLSFSRLPQKTTYLLTIVAIILYACVVGFRTSVFRASLMAILFLLVRVIERETTSLDVLAFPALVLLLINPLYLWDVGFQLSFGAVASIVYLLPKWNRFTARGEPPSPSAERFHLPRTVWERVMRLSVVAFGVTLSAQVGTTLIIAYHFYHAYPMGLIAGPFAVGLAAPIIGLTLISVSLGIIWLPLATPFVYANHFILWLFLGIIEFFGQPWAVLKTQSPSFGFIVVSIASCLAVANWGWVWKHRQRAIVVGLAVMAICIWDIAWREKGNLLEITFLDVGQGDAAFVRFPDGKTMLIDGGLNSRDYDSGERILEPFLCHKGIFKLDLLLLSHPDNDHGGGFEHILREFAVKQVLGVPHRERPAPTHQVLHKVIDDQSIPHELGYAGEINLTATARLELLHPFDEASTDLMDGNDNNDSLVLKITYGDVRILFTGDIEREVEHRLVAEGYELRAEILKTPHHGSKTSSSSAFLDAVRPQYAIFSLSERNPYGFPAERVVKRYQERGCRIYRTDQLGAIQLRTDGRRCWITHYAGDQ